MKLYCFNCLYPVEENSICKLCECATSIDSKAYYILKRNELDIMNENDAKKVIQEVEEGIK